MGFNAAKETVRRLNPPAKTCPRPLTGSYGVNAARSGKTAGKRKGASPMRRSLPWFAALIVLIGAALVFGSQRPATANFSDDSVSDLAKYVQSGNATNLKLCALQRLVESEGSTVDDELLAIAKGSDFKMAVYSTTALGKRRSASSKSNLKKVLENTSLNKEVRMAAMNAIAVHFKTSSDLTYLWSKASSDADLQARYQWLKKNVYGQ
jgi:hypothetical protein